MKKIELPGLALIAGGTMLACAVVYSCWPVKPKVPPPVLSGVNGKYTLESSVEGKSSRWTNANGEYAIVYDARELEGEKQARAIAETSDKKYRIELWEAASNSYRVGFEYGITHALYFTGNRASQQSILLMASGYTNYNPFDENRFREYILKNSTFNGNSDKMK